MQYGYALQFCFEKRSIQAYAGMEYFGYLRRDPDAFYLDWIKVLDQTNDPSGMVTASSTLLSTGSATGP